ncbi:MAG: hypothetical protein LIQ31_06790 [Planctomycetes bacterium]|nr:hypothetical protein [Planctomycetota bacterium]
MSGTSHIARLGKVAMAAALIATVGVSMPALSGNPETTGLSRETALALARPLNDRGDVNIGNIPVVNGQTVTANLPRSVALKLARPLNDRGDSQISNMPVLSGNTYGR